MSRVKVAFLTELPAFLARCLWAQIAGFKKASRDFFDQFQQRF